MTTLLDVYIKENGLQTTYFEEDNVKVLPLESIAEVSRLANFDKTVILGGDFYTFNEKKQAIDYAFVVLGDEYVYLNWDYAPNSELTLTENCLLSIEKAQKAINTARKHVNYELFFSLVLLNLGIDEIAFKRLTH